ncbi:MAG: photosystem II reaction center protein Ycf12/Psb30 [Microcoleus sp.]
MDFITDIFSGLGNINFQLIIQVALLAAVVISGPIVIFLLAVRGGDL